MEFLCPLIVLLLSFFLEMRFGAVNAFWHYPVCCVHGLLDLMERLGGWLVTQNKGQEDNVTDQKVISFFCAILALVVMYIVLTIVINIPVIGYAFMFYLTFLGFNCGALLRSHKKLAVEVENDNLAAGQYALSRATGYEVSDLDKEGMRQIIASRLAQNIPNDIVAPLFWFTLGFMNNMECAILSLWTYKVISIAAEKWSDISKRSQHIGFGAAKLHCLLTYLPARFATFVLWLVDFGIQTHYKLGGMWPGFCTIAKQAKSVSNSNAGWTMSAVAWLLNAGIKENAKTEAESPCLGAKTCEPWTEKKMQGLTKLVCVTAYANLGVLLVIYFVTRLF